MGMRSVETEGEGVRKIKRKRKRKRKRSQDYCCEYPSLDVPGEWYCTKVHGRGGLGWGCVASRRKGRG
jgi:hypothetical protein